MIDKQFCFSLEYPNSSKESLQADQHSKIVMTFTLVNNEGSTPITVHQVRISESMLVLVQSQLIVLSYYYSVPAHCIILLLLSPSSLYYLTITQSQLIVLSYYYSVPAHCIILLLLSPSSLYYLLLLSPSSLYYLLLLSPSSLYYLTITQSQLIVLSYYYSVPAHCIILLLLSPSSLYYLTITQSQLIVLSYYYSVPAHCIILLLLSPNSLYYLTITQAFIKLAMGPQEIFFVATPSADKLYTFEVDIAESAKDFGQLSGNYEMVSLWDSQLLASWWPLACILPSPHFWIRPCLIVILCV